MNWFLLIFSKGILSDKLWLNSRLQSLLRCNTMQFGRWTPTFWRNLLTSSSWMWRQQVPPQCWYSSTKQHSIPFQETIILILLWEGQILQVTEMFVEINLIFTFGLWQSWLACTLLNNFDFDFDFNLAIPALSVVRICKQNMTFFLVQTRV